MVRSVDFCLLLVYLIYLCLLSLPINAEDLCHQMCHGTHLDNGTPGSRLGLLSPSSWDDQPLAAQLVHCPVLTAMVWTGQRAPGD